MGASIGSNSFAAKVSASWQLRCETTQALRTLRSNSIYPAIHSWPINTMTAIALDMNIIMQNLKGKTPRLNAKEVAATIRGLATEQSLRILKYSHHKDIDITKTSHDILKEALGGAICAVMREVPMGPDGSWRAGAANLNEFFAIANEAETPEEREFILQVLAEAMHQYDDSTAVHQGEVRRLSVLIARKMGLSEEEVELVGLAARLHDIGKLAISKAIVNKKRDLTERDIEIIKDHAALGPHILHEIEWLHKVAEIVYYHHYYKNYPKGIDPSKAPKLSRIIALADSFDAATGGRIYEGIKPAEGVVREFKDSLFNYNADEEADAFAEILKDEGKLPASFSF
ncbi:HD-GYP domain-containing protein [Candidatus Margulisiibacteriota bacterium]